MALSLDANGWSILPTYANNLYVDSVNGNDSNSGTIASPLKTMTKAYQEMKDNTCLYLKRGQSFTSFLGYWTWNNSAILPYGTGVRPVVTAQAGNPIVHIRGSSVVVFGLDCGPASIQTPWFGIEVDATDNVLIEGCRFQNFFQQLVVSASNVSIRRNVIKNAHSSGGHAQGIYAVSSLNLLIEENNFDHNGWLQNPDGTIVAGFEATEFNHNMYLADDGIIYPCIVRGNIVANASGNGCMQRNGGVIDSNLFISNGVNGCDSVSGGVITSSVTNNVYTSTLDSYSGSMGNGMQFEAPSGEISGNLFTHNLKSGGAITITNLRNTANTKAPQNVSVLNNIAYDYGGNGFTVYTSRTTIDVENNAYINNIRKIVELPNTTGMTFKKNHYVPSPNGQYTSNSFFIDGYAKTFTYFVSVSGETGDEIAPTFDGTRTLEAYAQSIGLAPTGKALLAAIAEQSKDNWDTRLTATSINAYLRGTGTVVVVAPLTGTVIGTPGSWSNHGNTIANVFDGNLNSFFDAPNADGGWVGLALKAPAVISKIEYAPRNGWSGYQQRMIGGVFQGANKSDFSDAVSLGSVSVAPAPNVLTTLTVTHTQTFSYVRYLSPAGSYGNIAELVIIGK